MSHSHTTQSLQLSRQQIDHGILVLHQSICVAWRITTTAECRPIWNIDTEGPIAQSSSRSLPGFCPGGLNETGHWTTTPYLSNQCLETWGQHDVHLVPCSLRYRSMSNTHLGSLDHARLQPDRTTELEMTLLCSRRRPALASLGHIHSGR